MAAATTCGLFLIGKDEETQKCRDLIKTVRTLANDHQFSCFGQVDSYGEERMASGYDL